MYIVYSNLYEYLLVKLSEMFSSFINLQNLHQKFLESNIIIHDFWIFIEIHGLYDGAAS